MATAIVSIDLDHQAWLGSTQAAIAAEKAAIARPGVPLVIGDLTDEALDAVVGRRRQPPAHRWSTPPRASNA